ALARRGIGLIASLKRHFEMKIGHHVIALVEPDMAEFGIKQRTAAPAALEESDRRIVFTSRAQDARCFDRTQRLFLFSAGHDRADMEPVVRVPIGEAVP